MPAEDIKMWSAARSARQVTLEGVAC